MQKPLIALALLSLFSVATLNAEDKPFQADGYTFAPDEVHPKDWTNPDVSNWCTKKGTSLRINCLSIMPTRSKIVNLQMQETGRWEKFLRIPLRSHLYFRGGLLNTGGTILYYGDLYYNLKTRKITVDLSSSKFSQALEDISATAAGLGTTESYRKNMETSLSAYFTKSYNEGDFMRTVIIELILKLETPKIFPKN